MRRVALLMVTALLLVSTALTTRPDNAAHAAGTFKLSLGAIAVDSPPQPTPFVSNAGVRSCDYFVGFSTPAQMPSVVVNAQPPRRPPPPALPANTTVSASTTTAQLATYQQLWDAVNTNYPDLDFNGTDWPAVGLKYKTLIQGGLSDADFYSAMQDMVAELHDDHSYFQTPTEVADEQARLANGENFVGIGAVLSPVIGTDGASILAVFPGSPAAAAGLRLHDVILQVDGGPVRDSAGTIRTRGPAGSTTMLTVQTPGGTARTVSVVRQAVTGFTPISYCIVSGTRIGYIFIPTFLDPDIVGQVRTALQKLTADGPLAGLIIDNRENGGGAESVARAVLGFFTSGHQGDFVGRLALRDFSVTAENVGGSQSVPLAVLVDWDTVSYGEIVSGVLGASGRARVFGRTTLGNVELLSSYNLSDHSRAWIATYTFQPAGKPAGIWEDTGIVPSVVVPTRWDLFTEATDPALAQAVDSLLHP